MKDMVRKSIKYVIGNDGRKMKIEEIKKENKRRWVIRRKDEVVEEVRGGIIRIEEE